MAALVGQEALDLLALQSVNAASALRRWLAAVVAEVFAANGDELIVHTTPGIGGLGDQRLPDRGGLITASLYKVSEERPTSMPGGGPPS